MIRKHTAVRVMLVLGCILPFFLASCAKKQIQVSEGVKTAGQTTAQETPTQKVPAGDKDAYAQQEADRQAKLRELEAAQKLADEIRVFEAESIYFDFDRADLKHYARVILKEKAAWLQSNPSYAVIIEGHCDERGTNEYNLALGERRAQAAKTFLLDYGISASRLSSISYGEERPVDPGHNEEAWAKNRRDEFRLVKQ